MPVADEIEEARGTGIVYARLREFQDGEDTQELLVRFLSDHGLLSDRSVELAEARRLAIGILRSSLSDGRVLISEVIAEAFVDEFLQEVMCDRAFVGATFAEGLEYAGVLIEAEGLGAELVVNDRGWEDEGDE